MLGTWFIIKSSKTARNSFRLVKIIKRSEIVDLIVETRDYLLTNCFLAKRLRNNFSSTILNAKLTKITKNYSRNSSSC